MRWLAWIQAALVFTVLVVRLVTAIGDGNAADAGFYGFLTGFGGAGYSVAMWLEWTMWKERGR